MCLPIQQLHFQQSLPWPMLRLGFSKRRFGTYCYCYYYSARETEREKTVNFKSLLCQRGLPYKYFLAPWTSRKRKPTKRQRARVVLIRETRATESITTTGDGRVSEGTVSRGRTLAKIIGTTATTMLRRKDETFQTLE